VLPIKLHQVVIKLKFNCVLPCRAVASGCDVSKITTAPHENVDIILKRNTTHDL